jgi:hypothetical protein
VADAQARGTTIRFCRNISRSYPSAEPHDIRDEHFGDRLRKRKTDRSLWYAIRCELSFKGPDHRVARYVQRIMLLPDGKERFHAVSSASGTARRMAPRTFVSVARTAGG